MNNKVKAITAKPDNQYYQLAHYSNNGKNYGGTKELMNTWNVIGIKKNKTTELVTLRTYMGKSNQATKVYATIWVHGTFRSIELSGSGSAGGCGYHKPSAAVADAIHNAGITLEKQIDGVGDTAIHGALEAIAARLGYRKIHVVKN